MTHPEPIVVTTPTVKCDGGPVSGHPAVYLEVSSETGVTCPYCGEKYELSADAPAEAH